MKKQSANNSSPTYAPKSQLKHNSKKASRIHACYIYTEDDLGEGILEIGLNLPTVGKKQFNPLNN